MSPPATRIHFNQARLVRLLDTLARPEVAESRQPFAERLGQWLDVNDAIVLSSALAAGRTTATTVATGKTRGADAPDDTAGALVDEFARLRRALMTTLSARAAVAAGPGRVKWPSLSAATAAEIDFSPYHRYYLTRQREIETRSAPLRGRVRSALASRSPALRALATLDAALDQALGARERQVLAGVPLLLERRFRGLQTQATPAEEGVAAWLDVFCDDLHQVLQAEADLRLHPVAGMIAALTNEIAKQQ